MVKHAPSGHGGNVWEAGRRARMRFDRFLDFSSNINPFGPPRNAREILEKGFKKIVHYPDPEYARLREGLSKFLNVDYSSVFPGNGSSQIIDLIARSHKFTSAVISNPAYSEYENTCRKYKIPVIHFDAKEKDGFTIDTESLYKKVSNAGRGSLVFFCNPNNPTGNLYSGQFFEGLLERLSAKKHYLVVDEAFIDFTRGGRNNSLIPFISKNPRLIVLWSLTKIFAFPGLRLGAAVAGEKIVGKLMDISPPWSVNILAEDIALYCLRDKSFLKKTRDFIGTERKYLFGQFDKFEDLEIYPSDAIFFLIKILKRHITAGELQRKLFLRRILIRDCSNFRSLGKYFFRVSVKNRAANRNLILALKDYLR